MSKQVLTVILAHGDVVKQRAHLARGALFVPEPEPPPEPFAEIVLHVELSSGKGIDIEARVLQILAGRGIAVTFDDLSVARAKLATLFDSSEPGEDEATFIFWGRGEKRKTSMPPRERTSRAPSRRSIKPRLEIDPALDMLSSYPPPAAGAPRTNPAPPVAISAPRTPAAVVPAEPATGGGNMFRANAPPSVRRVLVVPKVVEVTPRTAAASPIEDEAVDRAARDEGRDPEMK